MNVLPVLVVALVVLVLGWFLIAALFGVLAGPFLALTHSVMLAPQTGAFSTITEDGYAYADLANGVSWAIILAVLLIWLFVSCQVRALPRFLWAASCPLLLLWSIHSAQQLLQKVGAPSSFWAGILLGAYFAGVWILEGHRLFSHPAKEVEALRSSLFQVWLYRIVGPYMTRDTETGQGMHLFGLTWVKDLTGHGGKITLRNGADLPALQGQCQKAVDAIIVVTTEPARFGWVRGGLWAIASLALVGVLQGLGFIVEWMTPEPAGDPQPFQQSLLIAAGCAVLVFLWWALEDFLKAFRRADVNKDIRPSPQQLAATQAALHHGWQTGTFPPPEAFLQTPKGQEDLSK